MNKSFTLVELLLVVSILGILAGVMIRVINPTRQQNIVKDSVRLSNVEKVMQAAEAYCSAEAQCPPVADVTDTTSVFRKNYIQNWPSEGATNIYNYSLGTTNQLFQYYVVLATDATKTYKYSSDLGRIYICSSTGVSTYATCTTTCTGCGPVN